MADRVSYSSKVKTWSFKLPLVPRSYRLSAGFWFRWTKDTINTQPPDPNDGFAAYIYTHLLPRHIRLLELHPAADEHQPISCTLHDVSLDSPDTTANYEALSYVWGHQGKNRKIRVGNYFLPARTNLVDALFHLRRRDQPRLLWIDALCINQASVVERNEQVQLMAEIYTRCTRVVVWLGLPTSQISHQGLEILRYLVSSTGRIGDDAAPWDRLKSEQVEAVMDDILGREYFSRVWVVQEAALAPRVCMQLGRDWLEWSAGDETRRFLTRIKLAEISPSWQANLRHVDLRPLREMLEQSLAAQARQAGSTTLEMPSLLDVAHSIRDRNAADPRDRIYGIMSLVTPAEVAGLVVDYTASWEETYRRFYDLALAHALQDPQGTVEDMRRDLGLQMA